MNQDNIEKQPPVPPFVRFVCSAVPMVFDDSLSYYEALSAMWKYLQDTVDVINNNATVTEEYIQLTKDMKEYMDNYFDNLDVQEEINNKLDAMVEAGTLQEIITSYIQANVAWTFDTVADMKASENLINGSYARTLGFRSLNDGGGATYYITDSGTANEMDIIAIDTLRAHLVMPSVVTPEMFGAYGDGAHDDTVYLQRLFAVAKNIKFGKDYIISARVDILSGTKLDGNSHTVTNNTAINFFRANTQSNITIKNLSLVGDNTVSEAQIALNFIDCSNVIVEGVHTNHTGGDGVSFSGCSDCVVKDCRFDDALISAFAYNSDRIVFENIDVYKPRFNYGIQFKSCQKSSMRNIYVDTPKDCGVYVNKGNEDGSENTYDIYLCDIVVDNQGGDGVLSSSLNAGIVLANGENHNISNAKVTNGTGSGIWCSSNKCSISNVVTSGNLEGMNITGSHISITSCNILENTVNGLLAKSGKDIKISGCYFYNNSSDTNHGSLVLDTTSYLTIIGNIFELDGVTTSNNNILTKTSISYAYIVGNVFKHYGSSASYADYRGVYDYTTSVWKSNGSCRFNGFHGLSTALTVEWDAGGTVIKGYFTSAPSASLTGFNDGDIAINKNATGNIGWVFKSGAWHPYGAITA